MTSKARQGRTYDLASPSPCGRFATRAKAEQGQRSKAERAAIAIYHATTKPLSRSAGRSAVAAAAYRAGVKLEDHRTAMVFDFTRRSGVVASAILAPADAGGFASDRQALWNAAEAAEKRKDSRTAREWILALPAELDAEQRAEVARAFARELIERYGVAADMAIHAPARDGDDRNHHAHILCTTRVIAGETLGEKSELELSDSKRKTLGLIPAAEEISKLRERWADLANATLEKSGVEVRIDHRSLAAQQADAFDRGDVAAALALEREPQQHVGVHATQLDRRTGLAVTDLGQARERAAAAARRAAFSASMVRAEIGPVWAESGTAAANDTSERAEFGTPTAAQSVLCTDSGTASMNNTHDCAESGPANHMRAESGTPTEATMITWPKRPRPVKEIEDEIARRSSPLDTRLDAAFVERREVARLAAARDTHDQHMQHWLSGAAVWRADLANWSREHPLRSILARVGLRQDSDREEYLGLITEHDNRAAAERQDILMIDRQIDQLRRDIAPMEARARVSLVADLAADAVELPRLREELEKARQFEAAQAARLQERAKLFQETAPIEVASATQMARMPEFDADRVAAFERGRVDRMGPEHAYQSAFNASRRSGLVVWDNVGIRGTAAALAAGNTLDDVRVALGSCWPGDPARIEDLVQEGRAQLVVDQVREAIEAGAEPVTRAGAELVAMVREYDQDDVQARQAVGAALDASLEALARDPALRGDQESDRPAPRLG